MNNTIKLPQKSRVFPENPYSATGYHDKKIASPIEALLSKIKANFGKISQNSLNFAALVLKNTAQKSDFLGGVA